MLSLGYTRSARTSQGRTPGRHEQCRLWHIRICCWLGLLASSGAAMAAPALAAEHPGAIGTAVAAGGYPQVDLRLDTAKIGPILSLGRQLGLRTVNGRLVESLTAEQETTALAMLSALGIDPYQENIISGGYGLRLFLNGTDGKYSIAWTAPDGPPTETALNTTSESDAIRAYLLTLFENMYGRLVPGDLTGDGQVKAEDLYIHKGVLAENLTPRELSHPENLEMDGDGRLTIVDPIQTSVKMANTAAPTKYASTVEAFPGETVFVPLTDYAKTANADATVPLFIDLGTPTGGTVTWSASPLGFYFTPAEGFTGTATVPVVAYNPYNSTVTLGEQKVEVASVKVTVDPPSGSVFAQNQQVNITTIAVPLTGRHIKRIEWYQKDNITGEYILIKYADNTDTYSWTWYSGTPGQRNYKVLVKDDQNGTGVTYINYTRE